MSFKGGQLGGVPTRCWVAFWTKGSPSTIFCFDSLFTILIAQVTSEFIATNNLKLICRAHQLVHEVALADQNPDEICLIRNDKFLEIKNFKGRHHHKNIIIVLTGVQTNDNCLYRGTNTLQLSVTGIQIHVRRQPGHCVVGTKLLLQVV